MIMMKKMMMGGMMKMNKLEVIKAIGIDNWSKFEEWMNGQTVGMEDGELDYYKWDVERFISLLNRGELDEENRYA